MALLELKNLSVHFGGVKAVQNVSFTVEQGEFKGLIGPNGAGKTTVFNAVTGVVKPTAGEVFFDGKKINAMRPDKIAHMGVARTFQNIRIYPKMSVCENVTIGLNSIPPYNALEAMLRTPKVRRKEREAYEKAIGYLEMVGLKDLADQEAGSLPYGLQRKLEIARALATNPKLLFLDEPAAGMNTNRIHNADKKTGLLQRQSHRSPVHPGMLHNNADLAVLIFEAMQFLKQLHQETGLAIVLIEHHLEVVMEVCKNITVLNLGALLATGTPQEIQNNPQVIKAYLGERRQKR